MTGLSKRSVFRAARRSVIGVLLVAVTVGFVGSLVLIERPGVLVGGADLGQEVTQKPERNTDMMDQGSLLDLTGSAIRSSSPPPKTVALTFDDGPDPTWTPKVLEILARYKVPGTFFMIGELVAQHPDVVREVDDAGQEIGNHTYTHPRLGSLSSWQIRLQISMTQRAIQGVTGKEPRHFRPPYSGTPTYLPASELEAAREVARSSGLLVVMSDRAPADFDRDLDAETLVAQALPSMGQGAVLTFHDGGGNRTKTLETLETTITILQANGYRFVTVSELADLGAATPASSSDRLLAWAFVEGASLVALGSKALWWMALALVPLAILRIAMMVAASTIVRRREARHPAPVAPNVLPAVSVVIPAYNEAVGIAAAVRSIVESDYPTFEVIVVDDGSSDDTADIVEAMNHPLVRLIRQRNQGKPSALNAGVAQARYPIVVMVDGDTIFERSTLYELAQPFSEPDVGAVSGNAKVGNRAGLMGRIQHIEYSIASSLDRRMLSLLGTTGCIPGAIGAFRRHVLRSVGGVSNATLAEDADLTMAIARAGWKVAYAPRARAWTEAPTTLMGFYRQRLRWSYGTLQAIWKHRHAAVERGNAGRLGRRAIPYQFVMGYLIPLLAPAVDVLVVYQLVFDGEARTASIGVWLVLNLLTGLAAAYSLAIDGERITPVWAVPFQQVIYRQLLYVAVIRGTWAALLGFRLRWQKLEREGMAALDTSGYERESIDVRVPVVVVRAEGQLVGATSEPAA